MKPFCCRFLKICPYTFKWGRILFVIDMNKWGSCANLIHKSKWTSKPHSNLESVTAFNDTMYQGQEKVPSADGRLWKWKTLIFISNILGCMWFLRNPKLLQLEPCFVSDTVMCQFIALSNTFHKQMGRQGKSWRDKPSRCHFYLWDPEKETVQWHNWGLARTGLHSTLTFNV